MNNYTTNSVTCTHGIDWAKSCFACNRGTVNDLRTVASAMEINANRACAYLEMYEELRSVFIGFLATRGCVYEGKAEIPEELSANFDIGLDLANRISKLLK